MSDRELYLANLSGWARMYVDGRWTLEQFEAHADAMREALFPIWPLGIAELGKRRWN